MPTEQEWLACKNSITKTGMRALLNNETPQLQRAEVDKWEKFYRDHNFPTTIRKYEGNPGDGIELPDRIDLLKKPRYYQNG